MRRDDHEPDVGGDFLEEAKREREDGPNEDGIVRDRQAAAQRRKNLRGAEDTVADLPDRDETADGEEG
ncbi:MAG: hypothetical protein GEV03_04770 [Streptosporangiales bacterium]|nr:hypothetical protein [Streptosporangiales bacterium]